MIAFGNALGLEMTHLPHQGSADVFRSIANGTVQFFADNPVTIESGDMKPLLVLADQRADAYPDVPAASEVDVDLSLSLWYGIFAPAGTPETVVAKLSDACGTAIASESFQGFAARVRNNPAFLPAQEFEAFARDTYERNARLLEAAGLMGK